MNYEDGLFRQHPTLLPYKINALLEMFMVKLQLYVLCACSSKQKCRAREVDVKVIPKPVN